MPHCCLLCYHLVIIRLSSHISVEHIAAQAFNLATFLFREFQEINSPYCFQLNFLLLPPRIDVPFSSVFRVSPLLQNNPTITNRSSPSSAPKFTLAVWLSFAAKKRHGEDKPVQRYKVCWMLNIPRHGIACQFELKWEPRNIILITLGGVKEHQPARFP